MTDLHDKEKGKKIEYGVYWTSSTIIEFIEFCFDVVQQYGYASCTNRYDREDSYWTGGMSTLESAFYTLHKHHAIKNINIVRFTEIKRFYKFYEKYLKSQRP